MNLLQRTARLDVSAREALFIQSVARAHDHSILDAEDTARQAILEKFEAPEAKIRSSVLVTYDELKFLVKVCRESFSFITQQEKQARRILSARLYNVLNGKFGEEQLRRSSTPEVTERLRSRISVQTSTGRRRIEAADLAGQRGLSRQALALLVAAQPTTVSQALQIPGVGRKTTGRLLELGLLRDREGVQDGMRANIHQGDHRISQ